MQFTIRENSINSMKTTGTGKKRTGKKHIGKKRTGKKRICI